MNKFFLERYAFIAEETVALLMGKDGSGPIVQRIMNFVSPARNKAISREILWYIPLYYQQQLAYQFSELSSTKMQSRVQEYSTDAGSIE